MRFWLFSALFVAGSLFAQSQSALESDPKGWKDIMPPVSLKGWTRIAVPPTAPLGAKQQWSVDKKNKLLVCNGDQGHDWLRYDKEVSNFIYHVEFRFTKLPDDAKSRYNSGIYARNNADGSIWHQCQIGSASGGYFFGVTKEKGGNKKVNLLDKTKPSPVKTAGEWNTVEIRAQGGTMSLWVNGVAGAAWENMEVVKGYVGLEAEGFRIEFRNVKIKTL